MFNRDRADEAAAPAVVTAFRSSLWTPRAGRPARRAGAALQVEATRSERLLSTTHSWRRSWSATASAGQGGRPRCFHARAGDDPGELEPRTWPPFARATPSPDLRRPPLDRQRDAGAARRPGRHHDGSDSSGVPSNGASFLDFDQGPGVPGRGRRPSLAAYVTVTGPTDWAPAPEGVPKATYARHTLHDPAVGREILSHLGSSPSGRAAVPPGQRPAPLRPDPINEGRRRRRRAGDVVPADPAGPLVSICRCRGTMLAPPRRSVSALRSVSR